MPRKDDEHRFSPVFEFRTTDGDRAWEGLTKVVQFFVPEPVSDRGDIAEVYPSDSRRQMSEWIRCRWHPNGDERLLMLTINHSNISSYPYFELDFKITEDIVPRFETSCMTVSVIRIFEEADEPYVEFVSERHGQEPNFVLQLSRSGLLPTNA